jgi:hypothetical protein
MNSQQPPNGHMPRFIKLLAAVAVTLVLAPPLLPSFVSAIPIANFPQRFASRFVRFSFFYGQSGSSVVHRALCEDAGRHLRRRRLRLLCQPPFSSSWSRRNHRDFKGDLAAPGNKYPSPARRLHRYGQTSLLRARLQADVVNALASFGGAKPPHYLRQVQNNHFFRIAINTLSARILFLFNFTRCACRRPRHPSHPLFSLCFSLVNKTIQVPPGEHTAVFVTAHGVFVGICG